MGNMKGLRYHAMSVCSLARQVGSATGLPDVRHQMFPVGLADDSTSHVSLNRLLNNDDTIDGCSVS
jgi:hypothetical protein